MPDESIRRVRALHEYKPTVIRPSTGLERFRDTVQPLTDLLSLIGGPLENANMGPAQAMSLPSKVGRGALPLTGEVFERAAARAPGIIHGRGDKPLNIAVAMEQSGTMRDAYRQLGHNATSIDRMPDWKGSPHHIQGDVYDVLESGQCDPLDLLVGHPSCTYLSSSGQHWKYRDPSRIPKIEQGVSDFMRLVRQNVPHQIIENPIGIMSTRYRPGDQIVQPWMGGDDASKATMLWLKNLDPFTFDPEKFAAPRIVVDPRTGKSMKRWANQTDSGQNRLGPSPDRWIQRSKTYPGLAKTIAEQSAEQILRRQRGLKK